MSLFGCKNCNSCSNSCVVTSGENKKECLPKIVLIGNPNVGKSVIFNYLSGVYVEVSNFPGTTVDISTAHCDFGELIDTPGAYSLGNYTDDEIVTQTILKTADIVVNVVGALTLDRDLYLTKQVIDLGFPLIVVVNQIDEANKRGVMIDCDKLSQLLGVPVISTVAINKQGLAKLIELIREQKQVVSGFITPAVKEAFIDKEPDEYYDQIVNIESGSTSSDLKDLILSQRVAQVSYLINEVVKQGEYRERFGEVLGRWLLNPIIGSITAILILYLLFQLLGVFVAGSVVDYVYGEIEKYYIPAVTSVVNQFVSFDVVKQVLVGEFGVLTMSIEIVFAVLLPIITAFYFFMALLEDSGYLPRLAVLTDNILNKIGLNGRAIIPLLLGFGCGAMGTITTRILGTKKERTIATAILGVAIPCAAQQGIIMALLAAVGGLKVWLIYIAVIFSLIILTGTALNKILKGQATDLLIDLPPIRLPLIKNTLEKTFYRVWNFVAEAIPLFAVTSVIISLLAYLGVLDWLQKALSPIVVTMLHLPPKFSDIFVMGLIRRDFASVGLLEMAGINGAASVLTPLQILVASVVVTLFVPCIATLIVIFKERGVKEAIVLWVSTFAVSVLVGAIISRCLGFMF